jgi:uncharacterized membrane protein
MSKGRMEAFSDGVLAIIITIMVLEIKVPHGDNLASLRSNIPIFLSYILSFVNVGIYWNNHHHMLHTVHYVNGKTLWANMHLLFWLSLFPFATDWMGENHFTVWPVALYGIIMFMAGLAYYILLHTLIRLHGKDSLLATAIGGDRKGIISNVIYAIGIALSFVSPAIGLTLYATVAAIWLIPDTRIEKLLYTKDGKNENLEL